MTHPVYIENLSLGSLGFILFQLSKIIKKSSPKLSLFYIDGTFLTIKIMKLVCQLRGWKLSQLSFKLFDICEEESGDFIEHCISTDYLWKIKEIILQNNQCFDTHKHDVAFRLFLEKSIVYERILTPRTLARTIYLIHVVRKKIKLQGKKEGVIILNDQPWGNVMEEYAQSFNVQLVYINHWYPIKWPQEEFSWKTFFKQWGLQFLTIYFPQGLYLLKTRFYLFQKKAIVELGNSPKIAVYPVGDWHFENDGFNSEAFFSLQSSLQNQSLVMLLSNISTQLHTKLTKYQFSSCLMGSVPPKGISTPFYLGTANIIRSHSLDLSELKSMEKRQLRYLRGEYNYQKSYWKEFFNQKNIKVYTTWYKITPDHIPIGDALKETGGIMTIWQRSYEEIPDVCLSIYADVAFGFSTMLTNTEKRQGSKISYYVATGVLKDHNRELLKPQSLQLRKQLQNKGAKKIISVFDENSSDDSRWQLGHEVQRIHYHFWAEKILQEPWLGVIFKPKNPKTLRQRLGDVVTLVDEAKKTGRLLILEASSEHTSAIPPVFAAMASDIAIQGCFFAGTTAMECALAGIPSLAVDYEGWSKSWRYQLGERVIFPNYESLWDVLKEHWNSSGGIPGLGDWSPLLDDLDPFRDGRAAERMGTYLHWLIQGFKQGLDREINLEEAAERYRKQWGADKIVAIL